MYLYFLENILLPLGDFINKSSFIKELIKWRRYDSLSEDELNQLQTKGLEELLRHTIVNVPYYKNVELKGGFSEEWIKSFPVLTKEILRTHQESLLSKEVNKNQLIEYSSSGSSGIQSSVFMNKKEQSSIRAILIHWWEWSGYRMGLPLVQTGITPNRGFLKTIKDYLFKTIYINSFSLKEEDLETLCRRLNNTNFFYLAGYASSLNVIAEYALKNNYSIKLKSVISLGDKLFNHYIKNIEEAFKCKVYDTYGCNEGFLIASQKDLIYKYIMTPHVYLEILDDNNLPVEDGKMGNVVVTRLDGYSMPLIRYKIGDLAIKLPRNKYPSKREYSYPLLEKIVGRDTDIVKTSKGTHMVVHSFTGIFEYIPEIKQFRVVQNDLNGILIEYIKGNSFYPAVLEKITSEIQKYLQDDTFLIKYQEVNRIQPTKSGKPQIISSSI